MVKIKKFKALSVAITCAYLFSFGLTYASTPAKKTAKTTKTKQTTKSSVPSIDNLTALIIAQGKKAAKEGLIKPSNIAVVTSKVISLNNLLVSCINKKRDLTAKEANTALGYIGGIDYSCVANGNSLQIQKLIAALDAVYYRYQDLYKMGVYTSNKYPKLKNTLCIQNLNSGFFSVKVQDATRLASNAINFFNTQVPGIWKTIKPSNPKELLSKTLLLKGTNKSQFNFINPENLWKARQLKDLVSYAHTADNTFIVLNTFSSKLNKIKNLDKTIEQKIDDNQKKLENIFKFNN